MRAHDALALPGLPALLDELRASSEATRDVFGQGECDDVFLELIDMLGWRDELEAAAGALPAACQARLAKKQKK